MKEQHPITPPPELVREWMERTEYDEHTWFYESYIAERAAQWGADQELEACCKWLAEETPEPYINALRTARRPKPPSLKEQALDELHISFDRGYLKEGAADTIRRALESINE
jgi:hypothetical protein